MKVVTKEHRDYIVLNDEQTQWYMLGKEQMEARYPKLSHVWGTPEFPMKYKEIYNAGVKETELRTELEEHTNYYKIK